MSLGTEQNYGRQYRVTIHVVPNLLLTSKQTLYFNVKSIYKNVTFVGVNGRAETTRMVTL